MRSEYSKPTQEFPVAQVLIDASRQPVVFTRDGEVFASSRDVAGYFEKEVKHVHEAIRNLIQKDASLVQPNFRPNYIKDLTGESVSHYDMTRDGFALLAMGFTGAKALKWKLKYIEAFNLMEGELRAKPAPILDVRNPKQLAQVAIQLIEVVREKDEVIAQLEPKAKALDRLGSAQGSVCISTAAKILNVRRDFLFTFMSSHRWIFKRTGSHGTGTEIDGAPAALAKAA